MEIDFANLKLAHKLEQEEIEEVILRVARSANYILGEEVLRLEQELVEFLGGGEAITCGSGSDALLLSLMGLGIQEDDEIITTPFTFIATSEMIALLGSKPVFVDISLEDFNIDCERIIKAISPKTKAILAVSLYGQPPNLAKLEQIAKEYNLKLIIDGAQSFGAEFKGIKDSLYGNCATTSFFPAKPLGCYGDGGAIFTKNSELTQKLKSLRVHGQSKRYFHKFIGIGGRLDAMQATILRVKLKKYKEIMNLRQKVASKYIEKLQECKEVILPKVIEGRSSVFAQFILRVKNRENLQDFLKAKGIPTAVHYPLGLHLQECFRYLGYKSGDFKNCEIAMNEVLSIPLNPYLTDEEIEYIVKNIKEGVNNG